MVDHVRPRRCRGNKKRGGRQVKARLARRRLREAAATAFAEEAAGGSSPPEAASIAARCRMSALASAEPPIAAGPREQRRRLASSAVAASRALLGAASPDAVSAALRPVEFTVADDHFYKTAGCTDHEISQLPAVTGCERSRRGAGDSCAICLSVLLNEEVLFEVPCLHAFHKGCARQWLREQNRCPVCSQAVVIALV